jgi:phosphatidylglycerophosphate synthase
MFCPVPNILSLVRIGLGAWFPWVPADWRLWLVVVAGLTDLADGWLARHLGADGRFGKYLDPVADKLFLAGVLVTLIVDGLISPAGLALLAIRDIVVLVGTVGFVTTGRMAVLARLRPATLGKLTTAAQFLYILLVLWLGEPAYTALWVVAGISAAAAIDYLRRGMAALHPLPAVMLLPRTDGPQVQVGGDLGAADYSGVRP